MPQNDLDHRLDAYSATLRASSCTTLGDALRKSLENWQTYAAVTGAAMAMATNASASIIYSGALDITASVASAQLGSAAHTAKKVIEIKNSSGKSLHAFSISIGQAVHTVFRTGGVGVKASQIDFLSSVTGHVKRLSSGSVISGGNKGFAAGHHPIAARNSFTNGTAHHRFSRFSYGWTEYKGFAAMDFKVGNQTDFGWVRLQFTVGTNDLINSITVIDWGYATGGMSITAGQGIPPAGVPEPSTFALLLLAAGAAGVAALRRLRKAQT